MSAVLKDRLAQILGEEGPFQHLDAQDWLRTIRRAQRSALLGKLASRYRSFADREALPPAVHRLFASAGQMCAHNHAELQAEAYYLLRALRRVDTPVVFLKGAAYVLAGHTIAHGRIATDTDILVDEAKLDEVEAALHAAGWVSVKTHGYDDHYYRQWMHELPPLQHRVRRRVVDVHHTILPRTSRITPDAGALVAASLAVEAGGYEARVLCPADMVVHAAVHMFYDGELNERLRDLVDIYDLLAEFAVDQSFFDMLSERAQRHGAARPVFYALYFSHLILGAQVPLRWLVAGAAGRPNRLILWLMRWIVPHALLPSLPEQRNWRARLARRVLYIRSHWLRMPPLMLARHLLAKYFRRFSRTD